jgi:hypothetical protein
MVTCKDFHLDLVQTAIFTPDHSAFTSGRAVGTVLAKFRERFDGEMQVLPLPTDVPADIPRVILQSQDSRWRVTMAPARIDSVWRNLVPADASPSLGDLARQCAEVQEQYVRESGVRVGRVALILSRICLTENPAQCLVQRFCNESSQREPFNRSESFEIHHQKVYRLTASGVNYTINSWVRCKSARIVADNRPVILFEQDLNTLAEESATRRFEAQQIEAFMREAAREADEILGKYFPSEATP